MTHLLAKTEVHIEKPELGCLPVVITDPSIKLSNVALEHLMRFFPQISTARDGCALCATSPVCISILT